MNTIDVEILNNGPDAQDLTGWYLLDDNNSHDKCFLDASLQQGEYLVIAGFIDEFRSGAAGGVDCIAVDPMSPSRPEDSIPDRPSFDGQGDDTFVEVDLFIALP